MTGWLRDWKLCETRPLALDGVPGWQKRRLARAAWLIPPGNLGLDALHSGCRVLGRDWADTEIAVFQRTHPDSPTPRRLDRRTIWLPHLPGVELRSAPNAPAILAAFAELARFHQLGERSLHGDPHAGNFLHHADRCRIIDFETTAPRSMPAPQARARDFAILALDCAKLTGHPWQTWHQTYGETESFSSIESLFRAPGLSLRRYWKWLGYAPP